MGEGQYFQGPFLHVGQEELQSICGYLSTWFFVFIRG
jgi:hypothetical protein